MKTTRKVNGYESYLNANKGQVTELKGEIIINGRTQIKRTLYTINGEFYALVGGEMVRFYKHTTTRNRYFHN